MAADGTEGELHQAYWGIQRQISAAERAIADARGFMYAVIEGQTKPETIDYLAELWLDRHGRDRLREGTPE